MLKVITFMPQLKARGGGGEAIPNPKGLLSMFILVPLLLAIVLYIAFKDPIDAFVSDLIAKAQ